MVREISEGLILHWNYRGYDCLPEELCTCGSHVCELYLKYNNITQLPDWIETMTNLTNIYLQANYLTHLPEAIQHLTNLETLDVSQNRLVDIPPSVGCLLKLKKLVLTGNKIASLPSSLGRLGNLTSLQLSNNNLSELPYALSRCWNLRELCLDCNRLRSLPNFLSRLPQLKTLSVCSNRLKSLPHLPFAGSLERFHCDGNPDLTHLPYPLACQWSRTPVNPLATVNTLHISCHGSFNQQPSSSPGEAPSSAPALTELVLRSIIRLFFSPPFTIDYDRKSNLHVFHPVERSADRDLLVYHADYDRWIDQLSLPFTLVQSLRSGPAAFCFNCLDAIFSCSSTRRVYLPKILVQPDHSIQPVVCSLLFCSPSCLERARARSVQDKALLDTRL